MMAESLKPRTTEQMVAKQAKAKSIGVGLGWLNPSSERVRQIVREVALAATGAGLGDITVTNLPLETPTSIARGIQVTDTQHVDLSVFWSLVEDTQAQFPSGVEPVDTTALAFAIHNTLLRKLDGTLDQELSERANKVMLIGLTPFVTCSF